MDPISVAQAGVTSVIAYFLKNKHDELSVLKVKVSELEVRVAVAEAGNKTRDDRFERIEEKLDRLLEKAGA
jgi:chaperonin cofactor prefoldin